MNSKRRDAIRVCIARIETVSRELDAISQQLDDVRDEEQTAYDGIPEKLRGTAKAQSSELAISDVEDASTTLKDVPAILEAIRDSLVDVETLLTDAIDRANEAASN